MDNQEQQRILSQLKSLRQQSLTEYLGTNLQSLANKQVIEDILKQFLTLHQEQFLTTVTNSILQVKQQCRKIKKQLKQKQQQQGLFKMRVENQLAQKYEKEMEGFFQKWMKVEEVAEEKGGERNPIKCIGKLAQSVQLVRGELEEEKQKHLKTIQECQQQKRKVSQLQLQNKQLQSNSTNKNSQFQSRVRQLQQQLHAKELLNKSLEEQVYQKHVAYEELRIAYGQMQRQCKQIEGKLLGRREMMDFLELTAAKLREDNVKLRHQLQLKVDQLAQVNKQKQAIKEQLSTTRKEIKEKQTGIQMKIEQLNVSCLETLQENQKLKEKLNQLKQEMNNLQQINAHLQSVIATKQQQHHNLQQQSLQAIQKMQQQLQNKQKLLQQQQSSTITLTHQISQRQQTISQLQQRLKKKEHQLQQYLLTKDNQIKEIQLQLKRLKQQQSMHQQHQQQYQLYLQEICELKDKIQLLQPRLYQNQLQTDCLGRPKTIVNKRTKIHFLLNKIKVKLQTLTQQNISLRKYIMKELNGIKQFTYRTVDTIRARIYQTKLQCDYCDHNKVGKQNKSNSYNRYQTEWVKKDQVSDMRVDSNIGRQQQQEDQLQKSDLNKHQLEKTIEYPNPSSYIVDNNKKYPNQQDGELNRSPYRSGNNINGNIGLKTNIKSNSKSSGNIMRSVRKMEERMRLINEENSSYHLHLSKVLELNRHS